MHDFILILYVVFLENMKIVYKNTYAHIKKNIKIELWCYIFTSHVAYFHKLFLTLHLKLFENKYMFLNKLLKRCGRENTPE